MPAEPWKDLVETLRPRLAASGFDVVAPGQAAAYNATVDAPYHLPDVGSPNALVVLIGNSKAMWPHAHREMDTRLRHPLDSWIVTQVRAALTGVSVPHEVRFAPEPPPRRIAIQRLAETVGLAQLAPCHLNVHPVHGPWISLRAAVVFDIDGPATTQLSPGPCDTCTARPCLPALTEALKTPGDWRGWLAMRDACPVGRASRFSDEQVRYHYTHALPARS